MERSTFQEFNHVFYVSIYIVGGPQVHSVGSDWMCTWSNMGLPPLEAYRNDGCKGCIMYFSFTCKCAFFFFLFIFLFFNIRLILAGMFLIGIEKAC